MKCIVFLSLVALCYSYPYGTGYGSWYGSGYGYGKNINVNQDGSITLTTGTGKTITITKGIGQNTFAVGVTDPIGVRSQWPQYYGGYQWYSKYQPTQADILTQILSQYQGDVSPTTYQQLLEDVNSAVQSGQISQGTYQALQNLYQVPYQGGYYPGYPYQQVQQLLQQQQYQGFPYVSGVQQSQYPYWQKYGDVVDTVQGIMPVGQQGQVIEGMYLQDPQVPYESMTGNLGLYGQQGPIGYSSWNTLINPLFGKKQLQTPLYYGQYYQYGQQVGPITGQLSQIAQEGRGILNQQSQVQQEQLQLQQQQQQLMQQQYQQQYQQQQQQHQQDYVLGLQQQQQKEQEQVLVQQQQQQSNFLKNLLNGAKSFIQTKGQQGLWQHLPSVYSQSGLYGVYGQGYNTPIVY